jgi:hypothetical protein
MVCPRQLCPSSSFWTSCSTSTLGTLVFRVSPSLSFLSYGLGWKSIPGELKTQVLFFPWRRQQSNTNIKTSNVSSGPCSGRGFKYIPWKYVLRHVSWNSDGKSMYVMRWSLAYCPMSPLLSTPWKFTCPSFQGDSRDMAHTQWLLCVRDTHDFQPHRFTAGQSCIMWGPGSYWAQGTTQLILFTSERSRWTQLQSTSWPWSNWFWEDNGH